MASRRPPGSRPSPRAAAETMTDCRIVPSTVRRHHEPDTVSFTSLVSFVRVCWFVVVATPPQRWHVGRAWPADRLPATARRSPRRMGGVERRGGPSLLGDGRGGHVTLVDAQEVGNLAGRCLAPEVLGHELLRVPGRTRQLVHPTRHAHGPAGVAEVALQRADDRRLREAQERLAHLRVEPAHRQQQRVGRDLRQVLDRLPAAGEPAGLGLSAIDTSRAESGRSSASRQAGSPPRQSARNPPETLCPAGALHTPCSVRHGDAVPGRPACT